MGGEEEGRTGRSRGRETHLVSVEKNFDSRRMSAKSTVNNMEGLLIT